MPPRRTRHVQKTKGQSNAGPTNVPSSVANSVDGATNSSLSTDGLPPTLLSFMSQHRTEAGPPSKRRKLNSDTDTEATEPILDFIVVRRADWEVLYTSNVPIDENLSLQRQDVRTRIQWNSDGQPEYLVVLSDASSKESVLRVPIPHGSEIYDDVLMALKVDGDSKKWAKGQGRLWTCFGLNLIPQDSSYILQVTLEIRWNVTTSPDYIHFSIRKTKAVSAVLTKYFPSDNVDEAHRWTPQDFYQAVHAPSITEDLSNLEVPGLTSTLYPFQKRALQWLLRREGVEWSNQGIVPCTKTPTSKFPISFTEYKDVENRVCYVSHLFGMVTFDMAPFLTMEKEISGGILSEEMGLGKTVEMISLISMHQIKNLPATVYDTFSGTIVRPTGATLIITPPSLLQQWLSEVKKHAPGLEVMHYQGIKGHAIEPDDLLNQLASSDVVVTTYSVLAGEIYYTQLNAEKVLRDKAKYPRPKSPLVELSWYRVCIDEAQQIESGVSNAAVVARLIPRVNAWCVTGTPVRKNVNDLQGLLVFLRYRPYANVKHIWSSLISSHKHDFQKLFGSIALRHSKQSVRNELRLPAQRRYVITMPFTPIEEQHYQELFSQMCEAAGLDSEGSPLLDTWDPDSVTEVMRSWLVRLRQTALHPEVGGRNRRALGHSGPLRTVDQVLEVMMEQTDVAIRTDQRSFLISKLKRGQLFENTPRVQEALEVWTEVVNESAEIVEANRQSLQEEIQKMNENKSSTDSQQPSDEEEGDSSGEQEEAEASSRLGVFRNRLRAALEIQHMAVFFQANAYFQIKSNEDMTTPDTPDFENMEKLETEGYERAKQLRQEILQEIHGKADKLMRRIGKRAATQTFAQIPEFSTNPPVGGIESRRIIEKLDALAAALDEQANLLDEWREKTIQFLLRPLVDEENEGVELTGEEYDESTKTQDEVVIFVSALRALIADRHDALTGQHNQFNADEIKRILRLAKTGDGPSPEKTFELFKIRDAVKPRAELGSLRGIVTEIRALSTTLRTDAENGSSRAQNELIIVEKHLKATQKQWTDQIKANGLLEKEIDLFTSVMNTRLEYYRQLQQISDMVAPYEGQNNAKVVAKMLEDEEKLSKKIATSKSKRRYLDHLRLEASNPEEQRTCVICKDDFDVGALTVCGHQYCKECISLWWQSHHSCPVCKRKLLQADLHDITYKPQELSIQAEEIHDPVQRASPTSKSRKAAIYSEISKTKLAEIKNIELDGPSFTTKVDTLARHLIWLRESDPGAKSIIYSQFKDFLDVLARAFARYRIGYSSIDRPKGIEQFKNDPSVECFLLHARAHSSGLNLVNASHVFLCEPLLNTALELQAIARVDRIGQTQETNVWLYLVDGTVEESIYQLSVQRRMEHIDQNLTKGKGKGKAQELSPVEIVDSKLEEANSMELQQASLNNLLAKGGKGGEMVNKEDLWSCLFGGTGQRKAARTVGNSDLRTNLVVGRELRAIAAESRAEAADET